jgi:hypothetical protein
MRSAFTKLLADDNVQMTLLRAQHYLAICGK